MTGRGEPVDPRTLTPPHDVDAEAALLGCFLLDPAKLWRIPVTEEHFYGEPRHRLMLRTMLALAARSEMIDPVSVSYECGKLGLALKASAIFEMFCAQAARTRAGVSDLEELRRRRAILAAAGQLAQYAVDRQSSPDSDVPPLLDRLGDALMQTAHRERHLHELPAVLRRRAEELVSRQPDTVDGLRTGFAAFDGLGGFPRGELAVLAGGPGMGKSALAHQVALNVAASGKRVLLVCTPEMSAEQVSDRLLARGAGVTVRQLRAGVLSHDVAGRLSETAATAPGVWLYDVGSMTTADIHAVARRVRMQSGRLGISSWSITFQYLADAPLSKGETNAVRIGRMVKSLKALARSCDAVMLLLSQLNRQAEARQDKRPSLTDLRDSGDIEQDADLVLLLHRPGYHDDTAKQDEAEVLVAKARNGPTGRRRLYWHGERMAFSDDAAAQERWW